MQENNSKGFLNDKFLFLSGILGAVLAVIHGILATKAGTWQVGLVDLFIALMVINCLIGYDKHMKNAVKVTLASVISSLFVTVVYLTPGLSTHDAIFQGVACLLLLFVLITFFLISSDSHGEEKKLKCHKASGMLAVFWFIVCAVLEGIRMTTNASSLRLFFLNLTEIFVVTFIVCIETKLSTYKALRDQAVADGKWTDEEKQKMKDDVFGQ